MANNQVRLDNTLNGYPHFMLKEINEIPDHREIGYDNPITFSDIDNIVIGACGSSLYAGHYGKLLIEEHLDIPVSLEIASEYIYKRAPIPKNSMYIFISQSGETADTIAMCKKVKHRYQIISICNSHGSTITRLTDANVFINVGIECGVAATKSFIGQMMAFHKLTNNGAYLYGIGSYLKNYIDWSPRTAYETGVEGERQRFALADGPWLQFPDCPRGRVKNQGDSVYPLRRVFSIRNETRGHLADKLWFAGYLYDSAGQDTRQEPEKSGRTARTGR